jgi:hypothetical protein
MSFFFLKCTGKLGIYVPIKILRTEIIFNFLYTLLRRNVKFYVNNFYRKYVFSYLFS